MDGRYLFKRLSSRLGQKGSDVVSQIEQLTSFIVNIGCLSSRSARRMVQHQPRIRQ